MSDTGSAAAPIVGPIRDVDKGISDRVESRYKDAYKVATFAVSAGRAIKALAVVAGVLIVMATASANTNSYGQYGGNASSITAMGGFLMED
jgi:hypothetical protein